MLGLVGDALAILALLCNNSLLGLVGDALAILALLCNNSLLGLVGDALAILALRAPPPLNSNYNYRQPGVFMKRRVCLKKRMTMNVCKQR